MTLLEIYNNSIKQLKNPDIDEINIRILLCDINGIENMSDFYLRKTETIRDLQRFNELFARFLDGEPVQYLINKSYFLGHDFYVDNRVLIPRQESEEVVDFSIKKAHEIFGDKKIDVADVCCGSGVMGISLAKSLNVNKLFLSDISQDAIDVTKKNLDLLDVKGDVFVGDGLDALIENNLKCNLLISNPPYVLNKNEVDESVLNYEPHLALFADSSLSVYEKIISNLDKIASDNFIAVFEIGYDNKEILKRIIEQYYPHAHYEFYNDMHGNPRILYLTIK